MNLSGIFDGRSQYFSLVTIFCSSIVAKVPGVIVFLCFSGFLSGFVNWRFDLPFKPSVKPHCGTFLGLSESDVFLESWHGVHPLPEHLVPTM